MSNEQWKAEGDCSKCRRKNYCKKKCTAHNKAVDSFIRSAVANKMFEKIFRN